MYWPSPRFRLLNCRTHLLARSDIHGCEAYMTRPRGTWQWYKIAWRFVIAHLASLALAHRNAGNMFRTYDALPYLSIGAAVQFACLRLLRGSLWYPTKLHSGHLQVLDLVMALFKEEVIENIPLLEPASKFSQVYKAKQEPQELLSRSKSLK